MSSSSKTTGTLPLQILQIIPFTVITNQVWIYTQYNVNNICTKAWITFVYFDCFSSRDFTKALITFPKPVIAVVNGPAVGLGMAMLPLCDIVYASDKATFYLPYSSLSQTPEGCASYTLPQSVGMAMVGWEECKIRTWFDVHKLLTLRSENIVEVVTLLPLFTGSKLTIQKKVQFFEFENFEVLLYFRQTNSCWVAEKLRLLRLVS